LFDLRVSDILFLFYLLTYILFRRIHASNPSHEVVSYELGAGTSNLRKHLYDNHINKWITQCAELKIQITAKAGLDAIRKHRNEPQPSSLESERQDYSKDAFLDAIVELVTGDDLVSNYFIFNI
jgi:hypothetical protein